MQNLKQMKTLKTSHNMLFLYLTSEAWPYPLQVYFCYVAKFQNLRNISELVDKDNCFQVENEGKKGKSHADLDNNIFSNSQKMRMLVKYIIFPFLQVFNTAETEGFLRNWYDDHGLKCLASNGKPCHFPFQSNGKVVTFNKWWWYLILLIDFSGV